MSSSNFQKNCLNEVRFRSNWPFSKEIPFEMKISEFCFEGFKGRKFIQFHTLEAFWAYL